MHPKTFNAIAQWIQQEYSRRKERRRDKEKIWKEVDRQVAMTPLKRPIAEGDENAWFSEMEMPLQFNTLEVILADARSLKFPRGTSWFEPSAYLSDEYLERWEKRREKRGLIGKAPLPVKLDQETADTLVKAAVAHYHRLYDFRMAVNLFDAEAIKYGTSVVRIRPVVFSKMDQPRMVQSRDIKGPAWIATSIKNLYLDDTAGQITHEGVHVAPTHIRTSYQQLKALEVAARKGGPERGWRAADIGKLEARGEGDMIGCVELLEAEGDILVPRSRDVIFLENVIVTVAVGQGEARVVRFRKNDMPFRSYNIGTYTRTDINDPYGVSPLMKGQPVAEAATEAMNQLMDAGILNIQPPIAYNRYDLGQGDFDFAPGAKIEMDDPSRINVIHIPDISAMVGSLQLLLKIYEDLTGVNDPRRGSGLRSHTTASAAEIEAGKGIARTEDFVSDQNMGPMTCGLAMEYRILKDTMRVQPVSVDEGALDGWVEMGPMDLADDVNMKVHGAAGVFEERQKFDKFVQALGVSNQVVTLAAQLGMKIPQDYQNIITEIYTRAGIENPARFVGSPAAISGGAASQPIVSPDDQGIDPTQLAALQAGQ